MGCDLTSTLQITAVGKTWIAWASRSRPSTTIDAREISSTIDVVRARATLYNSFSNRRFTLSFDRRRGRVRLHLRHVTHQTIVVLDFGSQFTQLIARRLRELSVYSEILPFDTPAAEIAKRRPACIILSGGPKSVSEEGAPKCEPAVFTAGVPILGICYGMQLMTATLGGAVAPAPHREYGVANIRLTPDAPLFASLPEELRVWASHGDFVAAAPA